MSSLTKTAFALGAIFLIPGVALASGGQIRKVDFTPGKDRSQLTLQFSGKGDFRVVQNEKQESVIVEAKGFMLPASLTKVIDVANTRGPVIQVTPYSAGDNRQPMSKFVIQLRGRAEVISSEVPGKFVLELRPKKLATESIASAAKKKGIRLKGFDELKTTDSANDKSEDVAKKLVTVLNAPADAKNYFGSRVTFEGNNVNVHDIFRLVGAASGLNIITDSDVAFSSNYSLTDIPWDQLLDIVFQQAQLKAKVNGNVVRIYTLAKYTAEQEAKLKEIGAADDLEPVIMAVIPLSFATAEEMSRMIDTLLVKRESQSPVSATPMQQNWQNGAGQAAMPNGEAAAEKDKVVQDFVRGKIQVDSRSNSLIITNTKDTIERIRRLVKELDVPLPQVLIDAKIVVASENFSKNIGVSWGGKASSGGSGRAGMGGGFASDAITLGAPEEAGAFQIAPANTETASGGAFGFRVGAGLHGNLNAQLKLAELNNVSKTVASPRVIVNNKKSATISDGATSYIATAPGANGAGGFEKVTANLSLTVTPQVTSSGSVLLNLNITKDALSGGAGTNNKNMTTEVLVDSGSTLVLGGVYQFEEGRKEQGIPVLKDLPFLGQLFRTNTESNNKSELMVFVTPQILEASESGVQDNPAM